MAIVNNVSLVKFGYGVASQAVTTAGHITFASDTRQLFVGDGGKAVAFAGNVANAVFAGQKLTITYNDGTPAAVLDFSDVASAEGVSSLLSDLRKDVNINKEAIATESSERKAADVSLSERIAKFESGNNSVATQITTAIQALDSSAKSDNDFFTLEVVEEDGKVTGVNFTNKDLASATTLAGVKTTADAAATQVDFNAHKNNEDIHITAQERTDWNNAKSAIDTFLKDASLTGDVIDTLTEIQDYIASDVSAADKLVKDLSDVSTRAEKGISDASTAQSTANQALTLGQAAAVKTTTDASLAKKADASTVYTKSETYTQTEVNNLVAGANANASSAETNAKNYADNQIAAIKVNGVTIKDTSLDGTHIKVGGTDTHSSTTVSVAIEDLYTKVQDASEAGVQSLAVNSNSSNYAEVNTSTGAVTLTIKKVALTDASATNTGVADAWDVKESIRVAQEGAISTVQGVEGDAPTAATVAGAKAYADAQIDAAALRWTVLS